MTHLAILAHRRDDWAKYRLSSRIFGGPDGIDAKRRAEHQKRLEDQAAAVVEKARAERREPTAWHAHVRHTAPEQLAEVEARRANWQRLGARFAR